MSSAARLSRRFGAALVALAILLAPAMAEAATRRPPPIEVTHCGFVADKPGRTYYLARNIECTFASDGIRVLATPVTIDMRGNTLKGFDKQGNGVLRAHGQPASLSVRNGVITNFFSGIETVTTQLAVSNIVAVRNAGDGISNWGKDSGSRTGPTTVVGSTVVHNGNLGIGVRGRIVVRSTNAARNRVGLSAGSFSGPADGSQIVASSFDRNTEDGLGIRGSDVVVDRVRATWNGTQDFDRGIRLSGARNRVTNSVASGNYGVGIEVENRPDTPGARAVINGNIADGNGWGVPDGATPAIVNSLEVAAPSGKNIARANDATACDPVQLCHIPAPRPDRFETFTGCNPDLTTPNRTYLLIDDITCEGDGPTVQADNVTIDLGGHTITGNWGPTFGIGVGSDDGVKRVTIRNGAIRSFTDGIFAREIPTLERVVVQNIGVANTVFGFAIEAPEIVLSRTSSVWGFGDGYWLTGRSLISSSHAIANSWVGFGLEEAANSRVVASLASSNLRSGIHATGDGVLVDQVFAGGNGATGWSGIELSSDRGRVLRSTVVASLDTGITVDGDRTTIDGNRAYANGWLVPGVGGIEATGYIVAPVGDNRALGNQPPDCAPISLCD